MSTVAEQAWKLRHTAEAGPIGKRHSSCELYALLAGCMALAERCRDGGAAHDLRSLVVGQNKNGSRRYVEKGSDEFILVCRFVFSNLRSSSAERSNASRYAHCLRQAAKSGLDSTSLATWLRDNGGVNALFLKRPLDATTVDTKCIVLRSAITVRKGEAFTITLIRGDDNVYDIVQS